MLDGVAQEPSKKQELYQFFLMERWLWDTPDQAGRAFAQFVTHFYQQNGLLHKTLCLEGRPVDLKAVTMPILNIIARNDYIIPPQASHILRKQVSSECYNARILPAGHIGIYVSHKTRKRLPKLIVGWLKRREPINARNKGK